MSISFESLRIARLRKYILATEEKSLKNKEKLFRPQMAEL